MQHAGQIHDVASLDGERSDWHIDHGIARDRRGWVAPHQFIGGGGDQGRVFAQQLLVLRISREVHCDHAEHRGDRVEPGKQDVARHPHRFVERPGASLDRFGNDAAEQILSRLSEARRDVRAQIGIDRIAQFDHPHRAIRTRELRTQRPENGAICNRHIDHRQEHMDGQNLCEIGHEIARATPD
ncbi:hypothetical protein D9M73_143040 [compost metagenome]